MTPKFAKIEPYDVPDLPGTVPGKLLGSREDVPVEGWYREVRNPELSGMYRPIPHGDAVFYCRTCKLWRKYSRSSANMWAHAETKSHWNMMNADN
jgi:hypothetical protein